MSVSGGKMNIQGQKDYKMKHSGEIYYFSSRQKMEEFKKDLKENIINAHNYWRGLGRR
jgi:YHS domain-containing protein